MSERIKVGVIGVGYLGQIHARIYHEMPQVDLVYVADTNLEHAQKIADMHDCKATSNFLDLLDKVDAVSIVVPTSLHFDVAQPFLEAGIPTLLEKPIAATVLEARKLVEIAAQNDAPLLIGHLERYNPAWMEIFRQVSNPRFIEVHRLGTFVERATDVDVITDLMIHDLDLVLAMVDEEPTQVDAIGSSVITEHVDIANVRLAFASGVVANITASRVSNKRFRRFRVFGPEGYFGADLAQQEIDVVRPDGPATESGFPTLMTEKMEFEQEQPLQTELAHFIDVAAGAAVPMVSGWQGLRALELAETVSAKIRASVYRAERV